MQARKAFLGYTVQSHISHAYLVGVVKSLVCELRFFKAYSALKSAGSTYARDLACASEFLSAADAVVVHNARSFKPLSARHIDSRRGRVGRERIYRVYIVVCKLRSDNGMLFFVFDQSFKVLESLLGGVCIEKTELVL